MLRCRILRKKQAEGRNGNQVLGFVYVKFEMPVKYPGKRCQISNWLYKFRRAKINIRVPSTISTMKWCLKPWDWRVFRVDCVSLMGHEISTMGISNFF